MSSLARYKCSAASQEPHDSIHSIRKFSNTVDWYWYRYISLAISIIFPVRCFQSKKIPKKCSMQPLNVYLIILCGSILLLLTRSVRCQLDTCSPGEKCVGVVRGNLGTGLVQSTSRASLGWLSTGADWCNADGNSSVIERGQPGPFGPGETLCTSPVYSYHGPNHTTCVEENGKYVFTGSVGWLSYWDGTSFMISNASELPDCPNVTPTTVTSMASTRAWPNLVLSPAGALVLVFVVSIEWAFY